MKFMVIVLIFWGTAVEAQELASNKTHQVSLIGIRQRNSGDESQGIAVVVSNRTVIRHYQSQPQQIQQLKKAFGGGGCGCSR